jgi:hypothetical protein
MKIMKYFLVLVSLCASCGKSQNILWEDGNYRVYIRPTSREIAFGCYMGNGGILGVVNHEVVKAGSSNKYIVIARKSPSGFEEYYYKNKLIDKREDMINGPYNKVIYDKIAKELGLPEFKWTSK